MEAAAKRMLYDLAIKNMKRHALIHSIYILITALAVMVFIDFLQMAADPVLMRLYGPFITAKTIFIFFAALIAILLLIFAAYWHRLLLKQRFQDMGLLALMGSPTSKTLSAITLEVFFSTCLAFVAGIGLSLLFYKLFAMILLKVSGFTTIIGFSFHWLPVIDALALIPLILLGLSLHNWLILKRFSLLVLLHQNDRQRPKHDLSNGLYPLAALVLLVMWGCVHVIRHIFDYAYVLANYTESPVFISLVEVMLALVVVWSICLVGFFGLVLPLILKGLAHWPRFYLNRIRMVTLSELSDWFRRNYKSMAAIALLLGIAFSTLSMGALLSRYGWASVSNYSPYSVLTTDEQNQAVVSVLKDSGKDYRRIRKIPATIIPLSYRLDTVLGEDYVSSANPGMVLTTKTYNHFARKHHLKRLKLKPGKAALILPITSTVRERSRQDPKSTKPQLKIGEYANLNLKIQTLTNHFPLGEDLAFGIGAVVTSTDYAKLVEGIRTNYYAYHVTGDLPKHSLRALGKLNKTSYLYLSKSYLLKKGRGTLAHTYYHHSVFIRQIESRRVRIISGLLLFSGIFVGLIFIIAMGEILMLKRLIVAQDRQQDYATLQNIGVTPKMLRHSVVANQAVIFSLLLGMGLFQAYLVSKVFAVFVNNPRPGLVSWLMGVCILVYLLIYWMTLSFYYRITHI